MQEGQASGETGLTFSGTELAASERSVNLQTFSVNASSQKFGTNVFMWPSDLAGTSIL